MKIFRDTNTIIFYGNSYLLVLGLQSHFYNAIGWCKFYGVINKIINDPLHLLFIDRGDNSFAWAVVHYSFIPGHTVYPLVANRRKEAIQRYAFHWYYFTIPFLSRVYQVLYNGVRIFAG